MSPPLDTVANGPFAVRRTPDAIVIVDARGAPFATVHGEYAHHDAPILVERVNGAEDAQDEADDLAALLATHGWDDIDEMGSAIEDLHERPEKYELDEVSDKLSTAENQLTEVKRERDEYEKERDIAERKVEDLEEALKSALAERDEAKRLSKLFAAHGWDDLDDLDRALDELSERREADAAKTRAPAAVEILERCALACEATADDRVGVVNDLMAATQHGITAKICAARIRALGSAGDAPKELTP